MDLDLSRDVKMAKIGINLFWRLFGIFLLLMLLLPGFALREVGSTRGTTVARTLGRDLVICACGVLGYWICGFALMCGGIGTSPDGPALLDRMIAIDLGGKSFKIAGFAGFFLAGMADDAMITATFAFQMAFLMMALLIPSGALTGRWTFSSSCVHGLVFSMFLYPVYGAWAWGGGWLSQLGVHFGLGNGHVDFAGSSVVHLTGGMTALAGALILGPRIGRFNKDGTPGVLPAPRSVSVVMGTLILALGGFGMGPWNLFVATDPRVVAVAVHAILASGAGGLAAVLTRRAVLGKSGPMMGCNGLLAGLVAIAAPCAFVNPIGAVIIGAIAGVLVVWGVLFVERVLKVDDPVGAVAVHGINGAWGCLSLGLFATGAYGVGWNGVPDLAPTGLFYGGGIEQLLAEMVGVLANVLFILPGAGLCFFILKTTLSHRGATKTEI